MKNFLFTSESVTEGHPDKVCDQLSDAILDAYLEKDKFSRCAVECMVTKNQLIIAGEVSSSVHLDHEKIAREVITDIGYTNPSLGFYNGCDITDLVHNQASELNENEGAGDQGIMFGYACNQTKELMPLPIVLAHKLAERLAEVRKKNIIEGLHPDGKSQVTIRYEDNKPVAVDTVIVSTHHDDRYTGNDFKILQSKVIDLVVKAVIPSELLTDKTKIIVNPNGPWFECGGPAADTGLTGRKIIVDTYGGWARHGGGAFSGKDASKVDRSGAYMARCIAKDIVANHLADECEVQLGFVIGDEKPVSVNVNTFGTEKISHDKLLTQINIKFNLSVKGIIEFLKLREPIFRGLSKYGHFGRDNYTWEKVHNETSPKNDKSFYDKVIDICEKKLAINPDDAEAYYHFGLAYGYKGNYDKTIEYSQKAINIKPDYPDAYNNMGLAYGFNGMREKEIECFEKATDINPSYAKGYYNLGNTYSDLHNHDKAIECYQKAIDIDPDNSDSYYSMGLVYYDTGNSDQAMECWQKAIALNPSMAKALNNLGMIYKEKSDYDKAIECYQKAIEINPRFAEAYNNMGIAYGLNGVSEKEIECYQTALTLNPDLPETYTNMGLFYGKDGNYEAAIALYQKAIDINHEYAVAYYNIGVTFHYKGDYKKAIEFYLKAAKLGDKNAQDFLRDKGVFW